MSLAEYIYEGFIRANILSIFSPGFVVLLCESFTSTTQRFFYMARSAYRVWDAGPSTSFDVSRISHVRKRLCTQKGQCMSWSDLLMLVCRRIYQIA